MNDDHGWLSPDGEFIACEFGRHPALAEAEFPSAFDPEQAMDQAGWWRCSLRLAVSMSLRQAWSGLLPATMLQQEFIAGWCNRRGMILQDCRGIQYHAKAAGGEK